MQIILLGDENTADDKEENTDTGSPCGLNDVVNDVKKNCEMKKPTIPEKTKHIELIRKKVWHKKEMNQTVENSKTLKELENVQQKPRQIISNVRNI